jgi:hypothetical protein
MAEYDSSRQAGTETEITKAMISAGAAVLRAHQGGGFDEYHLAKEVFAAMAQMRGNVAPDGSMDTPGVPRGC